MSPAARRGPPGEGQYIPVGERARSLSNAESGVSCSCGPCYGQGAQRSGIIAGEVSMYTSASNWRAGWNQ